MAKRYLLLLLIIITALLSIPHPRVAQSQFSSNTAYRIRRGTPLPVDCNQSDVFFRTSDNTAWVCGPVDTWVQMNGGGGGGGTPGGDPGELQWNNAGTFDGLTNSVVTGANIVFGGDLQVASANGRVWGITGLAAGHTVNFQYGGDSANSIVTTFGDKTIFRSFHGTDFFKGGEGITILSVGASGSASWFNGNLAIGSTTTNAGELYVVADSAGEPVVRADSANNPTQPIFQGRNITTTVWETWAAPWQVQAEATTDPTSTQLADGNQFAVYRKADKFVIAYNNGGTITYLTIPLDGSTTTWTQGTTAP